MGLGDALATRSSTPIDIGTLNALIQALRADVVADVKADLEEQAFGQTLERLLQRYLTNVQNPQVSVAAPRVDVAAPNVTVNVPDFDMPESLLASLDAPQLVELVRAQNSRLAAIESLLLNLVSIMSQPVIRKVVRGTGGLIDTITESRG